MKQTQIEVVEVTLDDIMPFISRARNREKFDRIKASIKKHGLKIPIGLRDITHLPAKDRRREGGGHYKYQLVKGEGRIMAHRELGLPKIKAKVKKMAEAQMVGEFLAENLIRENLPWTEKAKLVKSDLDAGMSPESATKKYFVTRSHILKFQRILSKTSIDESELSRMSMQDAEALTALPAEHQTIVMETLRETGNREIQAIVRKARAITEDGKPLSQIALKKSIDRVSEDLKELKSKLVPMRLHWSLGPQNLVALLENPKFKAALKKEGVNLTKFEALTK